MVRREALDRSRDGLSAKIHLIADRRCRPLTRLLDTLRIRRRKPGRPRTRPGRLLGDKAYTTRYDKRERI